MIIGLTGSIGSGKDTVAGILVQKHKFQKRSAATKLKDILSVLFRWDRDLLEGNTVASRKWREQVDKYWADRFHLPHFSPRWALQHIGTDVLRNNFHPDIFVAQLELDITSCPDDIVVSDLRFPNEVKLIEDLGGFIVDVIRHPPLQSNAHTSETSLKDHVANFEIMNDGTLQDLEWKVLDLLKIINSRS